MHYKSQHSESLNKHLHIDKQKGIISSIVILQEGIDKSNGFFTEEFLEDLIKAGNSQKQGVKCRFEHPNFFKASLGTFLGRYKNFQLSHSQGKAKVLADLHLDQITKKTQVNGQGILMWDYILEMSEKNPDVFGNSIVFNATREFQTKTIQEKETKVEIYTLKEFIASDLVDMPAATDGLFKSISHPSYNGQKNTFIENSITSIENSITSYPELIIAPFKSAQPLEKTYHQNHLSSNSNSMKIFEKLNKKFLTKDLEISLANGDIIKALTQNQEIKSGDILLGKDQNPLPSGSYLLADKREIVVLNGQISQINPQLEPSHEESTQKELASLNTMLKSSIELKRINDKIYSQEEDLGVFKKGVEKSLELLIEKYTQIEENYTQLAKNIKSTHSFDKTLHNSPIDSHFPSNSDIIHAFKEKYKSK